jgi:hypothetical protein
MLNRSPSHSPVSKDLSPGGSPPICRAAAGRKEDRTLFGQPGRAGSGASLRNLGVSAEVHIEWVADVGYSLNVSRPGPLCDGRSRSQGKVHVDANRRPGNLR